MMATDLALVASSSQGDLIAGHGHAVFAGFQDLFGILQKDDGLYQDYICLGDLFPQPDRRWCTPSWTGFNSTWNSSISDISIVYTKVNCAFELARERTPC